MTSAVITSTETEMESKSEPQSDSDSETEAETEAKTEGSELEEKVETETEIPRLGYEPIVNRGGLFDFFVRRPPDPNTPQRVEFSELMRLVTYNTRAKK